MHLKDSGACDKPHKTRVPAAGRATSHCTGLRQGPLRPSWPPLPHTPHKQGSRFCPLSTVCQYCRCVRCGKWWWWWWWSSYGRGSSSSCPPPPIVYKQNQRRIHRSSTRQTACIIREPRPRA